MFQAEFTFAGRTARLPHLTLCKAIQKAHFIMGAWPKAIHSVEILGHRRDGYPHIITITRKGAHDHVPTA